MDFIFDDGGRASAGFKGSAGDCVCRALAIAMQRPYAEVYAELAEINAGTRITRRTAKSAGKRSARNGIYTTRKAFRAYMAGLGWTWTPTMGIGTGCTVHLVPGELPAGRLIVVVSKHYTCVIDGVIHDTHNPSDRPTTIYSHNTPPENLPKGARLLENGNGWVHYVDRCVYGYWQKS